MSRVGTYRMKARMHAKYGRTKEMIRATTTKEMVHLCVSLAQSFIAFFFL